MADFINRCMGEVRAVAAAVDRAAVERLLDLLVSARRRRSPEDPRPGGIAAILRAPLLKAPLATAAPGRSWLAILLLPPVLLAITNVAGVWSESDAVWTQPNPFQVRATATVVSSVRINVRWSQSVTPDLKKVLEARYGLSEGEVFLPDPRHLTWSYLLEDTSSSNIEALVMNRELVEDTHGVDRVRFSVPPGP
jgi:hypothetical protein